ncbi:GatB/YqeY domain-containing protein [Paeniglutamicibacter gangotriensis]|uniref:GatB/Yqey domain-containing protein n=2 Tax=Paeniglutamicibacter gangotriensis TaxID=254787 RepID=M7NIP1_9MICC|nr:GatB/YqeY domain-containing protein [Paeniglutamicibacter gangotriensis]EMQ98413.1 GatB/Yqey domain-containing protein [Paeniglutamicibacter gangotriensis Lz1y]KAA0976505.1 glutamyl-tRNA amidotransferase [Paeniglutamicibacter gangotriensis]
METLKDRLRADMTAHLKAGNKVELTTVRNLLGEINTREKGGKTPVEMDDSAVISLLQKEAARRRETAVTYKEAGQEDRAAAEEQEAAIIEAYLPAALSEDEAKAIVSEAVATLRADGSELGMRQMGAVMKLVTEKVAGRYDGKSVSNMVKAELA